MVRGNEEDRACVSVVTWAGAGMAVGALGGVEAGEGTSGVVEAGGGASGVIEAGGTGGVVGAGGGTNGMVEAGGGTGVVEAGGGTSGVARVDSVAVSGDGMGVGMYADVGMAVTWHAVLVGWTPTCRVLLEFLVSSLLLVLPSFSLLPFSSSLSFSASFSVPFIVSFSLSFLLSFSF